ncbi:uncharacterized protein LOC117163640 [Bombus vancouverensis nearcticus]|uniref:uncharacterized protein LOC117163640 n=1 Tax=Bombus vancouverensis nearcticus TaxID=2705178 RepID=UPI0014391BD4|nr:uncharacterized protein LOC117163640 [Bombus vancouverensis nearcticus]
MEITWFLFFVWCTTFVTGFDLGPIVRIAQCRSQCLKKHTADGTCDWYTGQQQTTCSMCWQYCEALENQWEKTRTICEGDQYLHCPACQTVCTYRKTRIEEKYLPSMLPAPSKAPIILDRFDVAVVMRKLYKQWRVAGYYPGERTPNLRPDTWIIVAMENGMKHYSWQEWIPKLESLKEGALYEATISWKDVQTQLQKQRSLEQVRFNNRVRQFFLEKYGEKVLAEWRSQEDSPMSDEIFRRFFFRRKDDRSDDLEPDNTPSTSNAYNDRTDKDHIGNKESYVVSWEPETGGLMGNQVTDSNSAQISLLPGTKYLVRIASNDGPGSFPIEVDTRSNYVQIRRIEQKIGELHPWDIFAAFGCTVLFIIIFTLMKVCRKSKSVEPEEV